MALVILPEPAVQQTLDVDNLAVTLDGSSVLAHLYAFDEVGGNWDRVRAGVGGGILIDTELPAAVAAAENLANPTAPFVLSAGMLFDGATWDRWPGNSVDGALVNLGANNDVDTELPAAAALADAAANPTTPTVGAGLLLYNGATWDRARGSIAEGLDVDPTRLPQLFSSDFDTGAGTVNQYSVGIAVAAAGGPVAITGDVANGLDVDVTRVTGTVTVDSELPAAAALSDDFANPTAPAVGAFNMLWDGATWDRAPGNAAGGAIVQGVVPDGIAAAGNPFQLAAVDAGGLVQRLRAEGVAGAETLRVSIGDPSNATPSSARIGTSGADAIAADLALYTLGFSFFYNGATWDRMRGSIAEGLDVDPTRLPNLSLTDFDTGAGTVNNYAIGIAVAAAGGPVIITGDVANGLDVDVTRVTGTVTVDSELPAAALLADNAATPTAPAVGAFGMVYDGATWDFMRGNAAGGAFVQGPAADGIAAAGNPLLLGAVDGDGLIQRLTASGVAGFEGLRVIIGDPGSVNVAVATDTADGAVATNIGLITNARNFSYNGATYDRERNNHEITALASAARVATTTSATLTNYNARGMLIGIDVTAVGAPAGALTQLEVLTLVGATEVVMYTFNFTNLGAIGTIHLMLYPGVAGRTAGAEGEAGGGENFSVDPLNAVLPRVFRIRVTHLDANSITYSVVCSMIN